MSTKHAVQAEDTTEDEISSLDVSTCCNLYVYVKYDTYPWSLHPITENIISNIPAAPFKHSILLRSNCLIDEIIRQNLIHSIQPLLNKTNNYRDKQFINASNKSISKPKLQEVIYQFEHFSAYKQLKWIVSYVHDKDMPVTLTPAIFCLTDLQFKTEINGLLREDHNTLYSLIQNIFIQFIPMFECCLNLKLLNNNKYKQLCMIIKIQDYQFENENTVLGRWHIEGYEGNEDIIAVGLYYFDILQNQTLKFEENCLDILTGDRYKDNNFNILSIKIKENDCLVFRNLPIQHRARVSTRKYGSNVSTTCISRKVLSFFLLDPNNAVIANKCSRYYKWINFPWKISIFAKVWTRNDRNVMESLSEDIMNLIKVFAFGDDEYGKNKKIEFRKNRELQRCDGEYYDDPHNDGLIAIKTASD